ncbi:MAG: hypothetical protein WCB85_00195 [Candidatus Dormiibacterota bacterium]
MAHFTGDKVWLILGLIFEPMSPEELASTFTLLPPPVVEMWRTSGKAAFDGFVGRVRGTAALPGDGAADWRQHAGIISALPSAAAGPDEFRIPADLSQ